MFPWRVSSQFYKLGIWSSRLSLWAVPAAFSCYRCRDALKRLLYCDGNVSRGRCGGSNSWEGYTASHNWLWQYKILPALFCSKVGIAVFWIWREAKESSIAFAMKFPGEKLQTRVVKRIFPGAYNKLPSCPPVWTICFQLNDSGALCLLQLLRVGQMGSSRGTAERDISHFSWFAFK